MKKLLVVTMALALVLVAANAYACGNKSGAGSKASKVEAKSPKAEVKTAEASGQNTNPAAATVQGGEKARIMTTEAHNSCPYMKGMSEKANAEGNCCVSKSGQTSKAMNGCEGENSSAKASKVNTTKSTDSKKTDSGMVSKDSPTSPLDVTALQAK